MPSLQARDCKFANMDCGGKRDPLVARRALQLGRRVAVRTILALAGDRGWAHRKQLKSVESVDTRCNVYQSRWWEGTRMRWAKNKRRHSAPQVTLGGPGRPYLPPSSLLSAMHNACELLSAAIGHGTYLQHVFGIAVPTVRRS